MPKNEPPADGIDWRLTTWDGSRREQLRRWAALPLERVILAIEEMQDLAEHFQRMHAGDGFTSTSGSGATSQGRKPDAHRGSGSLEPLSEGADNRFHELETEHRTLAQPPSARAGTDPPGTPAQEGGAKHGLRRRAGGRAHVGEGTRPPDAATRYVDTALGILSYAELAPHIAKRVQALESAIVAGHYDGRTLDEGLFLELHRRICGDLIPHLAGRWRTGDVVVGEHEAPAYPSVPQRMREYVLDLQARLASLPGEPDDLWLETLAFAEGRLLSIHPFSDFNGRVTRVFIDLLARVLDLPDVDPTPDPGEAAEQYLAALRAADRNDWRALMDIWRRRIEEAGPGGWTDLPTQRRDEADFGGIVAP